MILRVQVNRTDLDVHTRTKGDFKAPFRACLQLVHGRGHFLLCSVSQLDIYKAYNTGQGLTTGADSWRPGRDIAGPRAGQTLATSVIAWRLKVHLALKTTRREFRVVYQRLHFSPTKHRIKRINYDHPSFSY